jgi:hypothetical protein
LKKDCKETVEYCFNNQVYLNTDLYTVSALMNAKAKPLTTHLILTIKLRHVLFRDNTAPRIKYVLEHIEEVVAGREEVNHDYEQTQGNPYEDVQVVDYILESLKEIRHMECWLADSKKKHSTAYINE